MPTLLEILAQMPQQGMLSQIGGVLSSPNSMRSVVDWARQQQPPTDQEMAGRVNDIMGLGITQSIPITPAIRALRDQWRLLERAGAPVDQQTAAFGKYLEALKAYKLERLKQP